MGDVKINGSVIPNKRDKVVEQQIVKSDELPITPPKPAPDVKNDIVVRATQASKIQPDDNKSSTVLLNEDYWQVQVSLNNYSVDAFIIEDRQILEIALQQSVIDPCYLKGYVTLRSKRIGNIIYNNELSTEFTFRGDGRDELGFKFKPQYQSNILPEDVWFTDLDFVVYDVEDLPAEDTHYKRIHFWHKAYHFMKTRSAPFSTANYVQGDIQQLNNEDRKIPTGEAIQHILETVGLEEYIDTNNWDKGSSKIFHTSSLNNTAEQEIDYILKHHVSEEGNHPCLFYYNRGLNKFQLISVPDFYNKAGDKADEPGEYQLEHFWVAPGDVGLDDISPSVWQRRAPLSLDKGTNFTKDIKIRGYNVIGENEFTLSEMSGNDSMITNITRPVHTYDHATKTFLTQIPANDISNVKNYFSENYSDKLFPGKDGSPLFSLNNDKTDNVVSHHSYTPFANKTTESLLCYGRNFITTSNIFLNLSINFRVRGSSHRYPGRFIAIEKNRNTDNKYDYKLLGQWFVTDTVLTINMIEGSMENYINAVKVHTFGDLKINANA